MSVALDIDSLPLPEWIVPEDLLGCGCVAAAALPDAFRRARSMQATASHGLKPGVRLRLWYWLDRPVCGNELKYGLREAPGDPAILGAAQAIYTAAPLFLPGAFDPLLARIEMIPGDQVVMVPPPDLVKPSRPCADRLTRERGDRDERALAGLIRSVARAANGTRNSMLYWASRRIAHRVAMHAIDPETVRALLEEAALQAGLSANEAAATVQRLAPRRCIDVGTST